MILIDNYDSFTYNIAQALQTLGQEVEVIRNDALSAEEVLDKQPDLLIIGPGPGNPSGARISKELIEKATIPLLGICLGHQAIGEVFGAKVVRANCVMHGKTSQIYHEDADLFQGLPTPFDATRYHSLILEDLPDELVVTAWTDKEEVMGLRHITKPIYGVQFHPESIASKNGLHLLKNFIDLIPCAL